MSLTPYKQWCLNSSFEEKTKFLETLFEHSDSLVKFTLGNTSQFTNRMNTECKNYTEWIELIRETLLNLVNAAEIEGISSLKIDHLANIIAAHPRLGPGPSSSSSAPLSKHSSSEQRSISYTGDAQTSKILAELNKRYENQYEGLRFVCFVNGRSRDEIIKEMKQRLLDYRTWFDEVRIGIEAMCDIALDRLSKIPSSHKL